MTDVNKHATRGNGWCFYQAVLEGAAGAEGKTDEDSHALATELVAVLKDAGTQALKMGGTTIKELLDGHPLKDDNLDTYLTHLFTPKTADLNDGPQEWADGPIVSVAYTVKYHRIVNIHQLLNGSYTKISSTSTLLNADNTPYNVTSGGAPIDLIFSETTDGAGHKAGHFDWFSKGVAQATVDALVSAPTAPVAPATGLFSRISKSAKSAISDARRRLKVGSENEIIIAGERVRLDDKANYVKHSDTAPISFYLNPPDEKSVQTLQKIFTGFPEFNEENPVPPCDGNHYRLLKSAITTRLGLLEKEIEGRRQNKSVKTQGLIRHYRKLEAMLDALENAIGCNKYGEVKSDALSYKQEQRLEELVRQFAFLVLQGVDPIDLSGAPTLQKKAGNAKALVQMLSINNVTEDELANYLSMRKSIPSLILNILDKSGEGQAKWQGVIDSMVLEQQNALVEALIAIINDSAVSDEFSRVINDIRRLPTPNDKIVGIVTWLVEAYVRCNAAATEAASTVARLGEEAETLRQNLDLLRRENADLVRERDAAIAGKAAADVRVTELTTELDTAQREKDAAQQQVTDAASRIADLQARLNAATDAQAAAAAKLASASDLQATLDRVNAELAAATSETEALRRELGPLRDRAEAAEAALAAAKERAAAAETALRAYREAHPEGANTEQLAALQGALAAAKSDAAAAETAARAAQNDIRAADARATAAEERAAAADRRALSAEEEVTRLKGVVARALADLKANEGRLKDAAEDIKRMQSEIAALNARHANALNGVAADRDRAAAAAAGMSGEQERAAAAIRDAQRALATKEAEFDALKAKCAAQRDELDRLKEAAAGAAAALDAEKRRAAKLLDYLVKLSEAIANGTEIPPFDGDIPQFSDLLNKVKKLRADADPSRYLCLLSYYVKFFLILFFNQPGGQKGYTTVKAYITSIYGTPTKLVDYMQIFDIIGRNLSPDGRQVAVAGLNIDPLVQNVFGEESLYNPMYKSLAILVVATQMFLSMMSSTGKITGCNMPHMIMDPLSHLEKDRASAIRAPLAPAPFTPAPFAPAPIRAPEPTPAAQRALDVEPEDRAPTPKYAPDAHTMEQAQASLNAIKKTIKIAGGAPGFAAKPIDSVAKMAYRTDSKILADYCSYGDARHPSSRYPRPDRTLCDTYLNTKAAIKQAAYDNGLPKL